MKITGFAPLAAFFALIALPHPTLLAAQDAPAAAQGTNAAASLITRHPLITGHPFSAIKYARRFRVLRDGKLQFLRNERYPTRIARDADGRLMMQVIRTDDLGPECDRLDLLVPPVCPAWRDFVIDPVAHTVTHWGEGEMSGGGAVDFPLTEARLEQAEDSTSVLPGLGPDFTDEDGRVSKVDLGEWEVEGIPAHGVRWTLRYDENQDGRAVHRTRIHEVWASAEMQLIVRVIDGDPYGKETVWGLEKVSLSPDPALFRPPDGYEIRPLGQWGPVCRSRFRLSEVVV